MKLSAYAIHNLKEIITGDNKLTPGLSSRRPVAYDLQREWKDKNDGTFRNFDGKTISGLKWKRMIT